MDFLYYLFNLILQSANCYLNNKYKKNHPFWNMIEDAYFKGLWPCGWEGKYPEGKLVVFKLNYA